MSSLHTELTPVSAQVSPSVVWSTTKLAVAEAQKYITSAGNIAQVSGQLQPDAESRLQNDLLRVWPHGVSMQLVESWRGRGRGRGRGHWLCQAYKRLHGARSRPIQTSSLDGSAAMPRNPLRGTRPVWPQTFPLSRAGGPTEEDRAMRASSFRWGGKRWRGA